MRKLSFLLFLATAFLYISCGQGEKFAVKTATDTNGYTYEYVTNDPAQGRIYTLDNGLKVFLSVNKNEPRISTLIGVRAGSTSDPMDATGLAHYFEHMMFKGTNKIGTTNWEEESKLLDQIEAKFEEHRMETDPEKKSAIYKDIDRLSTEASKYVAVNEYDKLISSIGGGGTNAGTSYDMTVYINEIPSNEIEKWLDIESERFTNMVLRVFHTELETVYEEFNMYNDRDDSRARAAMFKALFPNHPYGRAVIGLPEHLKNPSMTRIYEFAHTWYVPNNMAIAMSGDLNPDETIQLIKKYWDNIESKDLPEINQPVEEPITEPVVAEVFGPDAENISLSFRFEVNNENKELTAIIDQLLNNSKAGLIDLDLIQQQKVLAAGCYTSFMKDYGTHGFYGVPREGQTLEEVRDLLLDEIEKIKKGEFEEWMLQAIIRNYKLSEIQSLENNGSRVWGFMGGFINGEDYIDNVNFLDRIDKITKEQVVEFAKKHYTDNYAIVYKRLGENTDKVEVVKPEITALEFDRSLSSDFYKRITSIESEDIKPLFVDYEKEILTEPVMDGMEMYYIPNPANEIFSLNYIVEMGKNTDPMIPLAFNYLKYIGTDKYSAAELQQELFKNALNFSVNAGNNRSYLTIRGLKESMPVAMDLMEHILHHAKADQESYNAYIDGILKKRTDAKMNMNTILWNGLFTYARYGADNPFNNVIPEEELKAVDPATLTQLVSDITNFEHNVFYYGPETPESVKSAIIEKHTVAEELQPVKIAKEYEQQEWPGNQVMMVDYDMVQANIILASRGDVYSPRDEAPSTIFNEFYGSGLSSIVFQEIRESRALAYTAFSYYATPREKGDYNSILCYVGTQADKLIIATDAMEGLMNEMPEATMQYDLARDAIIKRINTERIINQDVFWNWMSNKDKGIDYDIRKDVYKAAQEMGIDEFKTWFNDNISGNNYQFFVLGSKESLNNANIKKLGTVKELTLEDVFGY